MTSGTKFPVGVSSCLLGEAVRYDGGHRRNPFLTDALGDYVEWVPVCPEVGAGLGVPREPCRLVRAGGDVRMIGNETERDVTAAVRDYAESEMSRLDSLRLRGFVLKKNSPSCGMRTVPVYGAGETPLRDGAGLFAAALMDRFPLLPVEDEDDLEDPRIRDNFLVRIFAYDRWIRLLATEPKPKDIVAFHTGHKMLILAHSPRHYVSLGRLVSKAGIAPTADLLREYEAGFMECLREIASRGRHTNVLEHLSGYLKDAAGADEKTELHDAIQEYRRGRVPLTTPRALLHHRLKRLRNEWVEAQVYLEPFPRELALRSAI
jgi:uncharacterized protein YbgA (DUF1722 family)/uncharacterized protein YbbK (DUF523 family)